jgi:BirA family biotin operon repressor/biotin-[acetyl-CoA-carboxylase] ligase
VGPSESLALLRRDLGAQGEAWPGPIEWEGRITSTSDTLKDRARDGAGEWTVVLADVQTGGRGRHGARWSSPAGNLFLSVLLRPRWEVGLGVLPLVVGVAVQDALAAFGVTGSLKWPNDVLAGGLKIGGILTEASWSDGRIDSVVAGVGVNVGLRRPDMPPEIAHAATSIWIETGRLPPVAAVAAAVLARLRVWYHALAHEGPDAVVAAWRDRSVAWWGRVVEVHTGDTILRGIARGVDSSGALALELPGGESVSLLAGVARELRVG